jgi:hypothetical protein
MQSVSVDGVYMPSLVLPTSIKGHSRVRVTFGRDAAAPYLRSINAILNTAEWNEKERLLSLHMSAFSGHEVRVDLVATGRPLSVTLDGAPVPDVRTSDSAQGVCSVQIKFAAGGDLQRLEVKFKGI